MTDPRHTALLDDAASSNAAWVGAKAAGLHRLRALGMRVPDGFCITTAAFAEHKPDATIERLLREEQSADAIPANLRALRESIVAAAVPDPLREEILTRYRTLGCGRVAVRSSATAEDLPGHSFAGQYDSFLDIDGETALIDAVKRCWASFWSDRAFDYRERRGFSHESGAMAVIVQEMIAADVSGVLFTSDPVTGRTDRMTLEACAGRGDRLVSGQVTPDRFVLSKTPCAVLERPSIPQTSTIDANLAERVAILGLQVEQAFGAPQDIEWAVRGSEVFLLQARPITALVREPSWEDRQIWTNANTGEVMPDVVSPMTWSVIHRLLDAIFGSLLGRIGIDLAGNPLIGRVGGRVYFNLNTLAGALRLFPGLRRMNLTRILGGAQGSMGDLKNLTIPKEHIPRLNFHPTTMLLRFPGFVFAMLSNTPRKSAAYLERMHDGAERLAATDCLRLTDAELLDTIRYTLDNMSRSVEGIAYAGVGMLFVTRLDAMCRKWLGDEHGAMANALLAGLGGMDSAEAGLALWRLAQTAHENPVVAAVLRERPEWGRAASALAQSDPGRAFLAEWDTFMRRHGHHTRGELELANPRWAETPDYLLGIICGYLAGFDTGDPPEAYRQCAENRKILTKRCRNRLRNPLKRKVFDFCLSQAQNGSVTRENIKSDAIRYWTAIRRLLLEVGERLAQRGALASRDDVFLLSFDELASFVRSESNPDLSVTISARKSELAVFRAVTPPCVIFGQFDPASAAAQADPPSNRLEAFAGIPVSPGLARGRARIILRPDTEERVEVGEILVAPFTDPGWSPYFVPAAGIVMDQGGLLSHGSIVAREYGIPAVVNVGHATRFVKTGQLLEVDGDRGRVRILQG